MVLPSHEMVALAFVTTTLPSVSKKSFTIAVVVATFVAALGTSTAYFISVTSDGTTCGLSVQAS